MRRAPFSPVCGVSIVGCSHSEHVWTRRVVASMDCGLQQNGALVLFPAESAIIITVARTVRSTTAHARAASKSTGTGRSACFTGSAGK